jgi:type VI secretion system protein ImpM
MEVGLYGKLPSHGDFLRRRVSDSFVAAWDEWLQQSVAASQAALGDDWLDVYLTSPLWRFVCDAGVCGPGGYAGLIAPSVDRVGRYFPLTLVWELPGGASPFLVAQQAEGWFDLVERVLLETFAEEDVDFERFDTRLMEANGELERVHWTASIDLDANEASAPCGGTRAQWKLPLGTATAVSAVVEQLLYARLRETHGPLTLLWTEGSSIVEPSCLLLGGLPAPNTYVAMLNGRWGDEGWRVIRGEATSAALDSEQWETEGALSYHSAGLTHVGRVRTVNQDAFLERTELGVWAVADGMGGHDGGEVASRMVCDALASIIPDDTLEGTVKLIEERLNLVNEQLRRTGPRSSDTAQSGSTGVVLVSRGARCVILWVGDSRIYRLRGGELVQLTRDHVADPSEGEPEHAITRAIGGEDTLEIDVAYSGVLPGDRFLLCSDGLTHEVTDDVVQQKLGQADVSSCVQELLSAALDAGGRDNVSIIVVDVTESTTSQDIEEQMAIRS